MQKKKFVQPENTFKWENNTECCNTVLLWSSRNVLWTTTLHQTLVGMGMSRYRLNWSYPENWLVSLLFYTKTWLNSTPGDSDLMVSDVAELNLLKIDFFFSHHSECVKVIFALALRLFQGRQQWGNPEKKQERWQWVQIGEKPPQPAGSCLHARWDIWKWSRRLRNTETLCDVDLDAHCCFIRNCLKVQCVGCKGV